SAPEPAARCFTRLLWWSAYCSMSSLIVTFGCCCSNCLYRSWYPKSPNRSTRSVIGLGLDPELVSVALLDEHAARTNATRTALSRIPRFHIVRPPTARPPSGFLTRRLRLTGLRRESALTLSALCALGRALSSETRPGREKSRGEIRDGRPVGSP